jgi:hypothetical protein
MRRGLWCARGNYTDFPVITTCDAVVFIYDPAHRNHPSFSVVNFYDASAADSLSFSMPIFALP